MTDATLAAPAVAATPVQSALADIWKQFRVHKGGVAGLFVFIFILLAVYVGPYIHTVAPNAINVKERNQWPSLAHPFGTDNLGKDMLAQVLAGGRISLAVGITAMLLALFLGTLVGVLSGYFRRLDGPLMRLTDLFWPCRCCRCCSSFSCCSVIRCVPLSGRKPVSSSSSSS